MSELKTLKDLEYCQLQPQVSFMMGAGYAKPIIMVSIDGLKKEVIKHIAKLESGVTSCIKEGDESLATIPMSKIDWIKEFFNISEEELK